MSAADTPCHYTLVFDVAGWPAHRAGQHVDLRLTAADGYQAQRSYSLAAPADGERVELGVELIEEGELGWTEAGVPVWASVEQPASRLPGRGTELVDDDDPELDLLDDLCDRDED